MTAEQLEELLGKVTQGEWRNNRGSIDANGSCDTISCSVMIGLAWVNETEQYDDDGRCFVLSGNREANATLIALAPSLARRVLAAEKLVEAGCVMSNALKGDYIVPGSAKAWDAALTSCREASK